MDDSYHPSYSETAGPNFGAMAIQDILGHSNEVSIILQACINQGSMSTVFALFFFLIAFIRYKYTGKFKSAY